MLIVLVMCLNLPGRVIEEKGKEAVVYFNGVRVKAVNLAKAKKGEYVIVQNNVIIERISTKEALEILQVVAKRKKKKKKSSS